MGQICCVLSEYWTRNKILKLSNSKHIADIDKSWFKHDCSRPNTADAVSALTNETSGMRVLLNRFPHVHNG
jgi:hypothetical protein